MITHNRSLSRPPKVDGLKQRSRFPISACHAPAMKLFLGHRNDPPLIIVVHYPYAARAFTDADGSVFGKTAPIGPPQHCHKDQPALISGLRIPHADQGAGGSAFLRWLRTKVMRAVSSRASVDGPSDARGKARNLTGGAIAVMCPASHEGVPVKLFLHPRPLRVCSAVAHFNCLPRRSSRHSRALPCKPHIRRDDVPTTVPHSGRESSRRTAPLC